MNHERHARRDPLRVRQLGALRRGAGRQLRAHHVREIDAGLLEHGAVAQHAALAAAAFGALPRVAAKARCAVRLLERGTDAVLQSAQIGQHCRDVGSGRRHDYFLVAGVRFAVAFFFVAGGFAGALAVAFAGAFAVAVRRGLRGASQSSRPSAAPRAGFSAAGAARRLPRQGPQPSFSRSGRSGLCHAPARRRSAPCTRPASASSDRDPWGSWRSSRDR